MNLDELLIVMEDYYPALILKKAEFILKNTKSERIFIGDYLELDYLDQYVIKEFENNQRLVVFKTELIFSNSHNEDNSVECWFWSFSKQIQRLFIETVMLGEYKMRLTPQLLNRKLNIKCC